MEHFSLKAKNLAAKMQCLPDLTDKTVCWMEKYFDPKNGFFYH